MTVTGNVAAGYSLDVHRSAFAPADLPLGIATSAPTGGQLGPGLAGGARAAIPISPAADLVVGTTAGPSAVTGDVWPATLGFTAALPAVPAGPVLGGGHLHGSQPVRGAATLAAVLTLLAPAVAGASRQPAALAIAAWPARVVLTTPGRATIHVENPGDDPVVIDAAPAGYRLDLRGRPRLRAARRVRGLGPRFARLGSRFREGRWRS